MKSKMQLDLAVEEIYINIARYAYAPDKGRATVRVEVSGEPVTVAITFIDRGVPRPVAAVFRTGLLRNRLYICPRRSERAEEKNISSKK